MNKKVLLSVAAVAVVTIGIIGFVALGGDDKPAKDNKANATSESLSATKACDLFTLSEAKQLMGDAATLGSTTEAASSDDVSVDNCSYVNNATTVPELRTATIMVRSALSDLGKTSNQDAFKAGGAANPSGATAVSGYGDKAFWDPATYQLAVLKGNTWIGIVYGGTNPTSNTLDDAKKVADLVVK
jgi:hypothetical protein